MDTASTCYPGWKRAETAYVGYKAQDIVNYYYSDVIMGKKTSQITSMKIVYPTVYSGANQQKTTKLRVTGLCEGF